MEENNHHIFSLQMYIYSLSLDCDAKQVDVGLAERIIFPAKPISTHFSWRKRVDVGLAGKLFFQPNLHLLTFIGKQVDVKLAG
jgi:hypothetical protein